MVDPRAGWPGSVLSGHPMSASDLGGPRLASSLLVLLLAAVAVALGVGAVRYPLGALLVLGTAALIVISFRSVDIALLILVATGPLENAFQISPTSQITISKLAGLLCFGSFFFQSLQSRRKLVFDSTHAILLLLLGLALVSSVGARDPSTALSTTIRYASFIVLYAVVTQMVDRRLQRRIVWVLTASASVAVWMALSNYISGFSASATLSYGEPNDLALMLAATLPLTFWLLITQRRARTLVVALIGLMAAAILLTFSRGALVGLGAGLTWHAIVERRHIPALLGGVLVALLAAMLVVRNDPSKFDLSLRAKSRVAEQNVETRLDLWEGAANLAAAHPVIGVGPGNFRLHYAQSTGSPVGTTTLVVHNAYLEAAAEMGVLGGVILMLYLIIVMARIRVARLRGAGAPGLAAAIRTALVVVVVSSLAHSQQYLLPFWLLGGLATALWAEAEGRLAPARE
jgi:putative inorganic carbon (hco3(-)) transporter